MSDVSIFVNMNQVPFYTVQNLSCADEGPRAVPLLFDFSLTDTYIVDLQNVQARVLISEVQAIYFDNRANTASLIVYLPIADQTMEFAAGTFGYWNVLCPNPAKLQFISSGTGFVRVKLLNFPVINCVYPASGASSIVTTSTIKTVVTANPVAGSNFSIVVPANVIWTPLSLAFTFTTSATVASRTIAITMDDGVNIFSVNALSQAVIASKVFQVTVNSDALTSNVVINQYTIPAFSGIELIPGFRINSLVTFIQAADQISGITLLVEETAI